MQYIKLFLERTVTITGTCKTNTCIIDSTIIEGTLSVSLRYFLVTCLQSCLIDSPIVVCILQSRRGCCTTFVKRNISQLHIISYTFIIRNGGCTDHCRQCLIHIRKDAFGYCIRQYRHSMITAHTPVFISHQTPYRQHSVHALLLMFNHGFHHIRIASRFHQIQERMFRTIGIPKGKYSIVGKSFRPVYVMIQPTIGTVYIHIHRRINHGVVKRSIEHCFLIGRTFDLEMLQFTIPICTSSFRQLFETLSGSLGMQILNGPFRTDCRQCHFYNQFRIVSGIEVKVSHDFSTCDFGEVLFQLKTTPKAIVQYFFLILISVVFNRL